MEDVKLTGIANEVRAEVVRAIGAIVAADDRVRDTNARAKEIEVYSAAFARALGNSVEDGRQSRGGRLPAIP